ncbi:hypothetical protein RsTz2092_03180 [Deferribacterales bacterium RsTz2092]
MRKEFLRWFSPTFRRADDNNKRLDEIKRLVYHGQHDVASAFSIPIDEDIRYAKLLYEGLKGLNLPNDYQNFVRGLDSNDRDSFRLYLKRLINIAECGARSIRWREDEMKRLIEAYDTLAYAPFELTNDIFVCGDYLFPKHIFPFPYLDKMGIPLLHHPERLNGLDFIDGGASIGDSALVMSEYTTGNVHAFEPTKEGYELMLKTLEINHSTKIVPVRKGLSDKCGFATIYVDETGTGSALIKQDVYRLSGEERIELTTIDEYVKANNLKIGLIKSDIEGAEMLLLKGAEETIRTQKPALIISIYHNAKDLFLIKPMIESWNLGYKFSLFRGAPESAFIELALIAEMRSTTPPLHTGLHRCAGGL